MNTCFKCGELILCIRTFNHIWNMYSYNRIWEIAVTKNCSEKSKIFLFQNANFKVLLIFWRHFSWKLLNFLGIFPYNLLEVLEGNDATKWYNSLDLEIDILEKEIFTNWCGKTDKNKLKYIMRQIFPFPKVSSKNFMEKNLH
jgi:hypothetical protein